ncbi:MAG: hypothetical protein LBR45_05440 [Bacteroidales bacterium]|jgi:hypothetical protein|nr:hypothetical protein [Bacteroidales bacterium]
MKKILSIAVFTTFCACFCVYGQRNAQTKVAGNYSYTVSCLGTELDGSQTLEVWGYGRNRFDAAEQAKKNAVYAVLFDGIRDGREGCEVKPLLTGVNAREKHQNYFNQFFADKGEYLNYVSLRDERIDNKFTREKKGAKHGNTRSVIVRVLRPQLEQKLISDNILK